MSVLERIYFFHERIRAGRYPNTRLLIEEFEISQATAHRDIRYLRDRLLAPLAYDKGKNGFYYTDKNFVLPFENSPSMMLILGLVSSLARQSGLEELPELAAMHKRLQKILFPGQRNMDDLLHCEWVAREPVNQKNFTAVLAGLKNKQQLHITYRDLGGNNSTREVEPLKLINYEGRWYLLAWCLRRNANRIFHLARMSKVRLLTIPASGERETDADWLTTSFGIFKGPARKTARLCFTGMAAETVRFQIWHEEQKITERGRDLILELPIHDERELAMKVLQFGAQAEVLAPDTLRARVQGEIRAMADHYGL